MSTFDQELADLLNNESFCRWVRGNASDVEQLRWEAWENTDATHRELKVNAEMFYQMQMADDAEDVEMQVDSLNQRIDQAERDADTTQFQKMKPKRNMKGYKVAVAATVALLLSVVGVFYLYYPASIYEKDTESLFTTVDVASGEKSSITFSDGSLIRLNSKSSLKYNQEQAGTRRVDVWLEGEGYFNIAHNPDGKTREFVVHTADGKVRVLGTKFNVNTRFQKTSVVLEEGRVEVSMKESPHNSHNASKEKILEPGERAVIAASSSGIMLQKVNVDVFTSWLDGEIKFQDTSLEEISTYLEATYGVSLYVDDSDILNRQITGTVQNPNLQSLIAVLEKILDLEINQINESSFRFQSRQLNE